MLCKGLFATYPGISQTLNRIQPYWRGSTFLIQKLLELHHFGWEHIERTALMPAPYLGRKKLHRSPSNWEKVHWLGPALIRKSLQRLVRRPMIDHWRMAIRVGSRSVLAAGAVPDLNGFQGIESPDGRFYADPFLIETDGQVRLYFEDFDYATERGSISCAEIQNEILTSPVPALERHYHLLYPCVFRDGDALYMIPETGSNGTVELYRCVRFPDVWELEKALFKAQAVDTTIWIEGSVYWFSLP